MHPCLLSKMMRVSRVSVQDIPEKCKIRIFALGVAERMHIPELSLGSGLTGTQSAFSRYARSAASVPSDQTLDSADENAARKRPLPPTSP